MSEETLSNLLKEDRRFEPPADLAADANLKEEAYDVVTAGVKRGRRIIDSNVSENVAARLRRAPARARHAL